MFRFPAFVISACILAACSGNPFDQSEDTAPAPAPTAHRAALIPAVSVATGRPPSQARSIRPLMQVSSEERRVGPLKAKLKATALPTISAMIRSMTHSMSKVWLSTAISRAGRNTAALLFH